MRGSSISTLLSFKRALKIPHGERELALLTIDQITIATFGILAVLLNLQAFLSENQTTYWQLIFVALSIVCWVLGTLHVRSTGSQYAFIPLFVVFLATPIVVEPWIKNSWTSYGLIVVAGVAYFSAFPSQYFSLSFIILCALLQGVVSTHSFHSPTDKADLSYAGTYFSTTWVLLVGVMLFIIRGRYLKYCEEIDEKLEELERANRARNRNIRLLNSQDFQNLKMHGTVLNTLLVIQRNIEIQGDSQQAIKLLAQEVENLSDTDPALRTIFQDRLIQEFRMSPIQKAEVSLLNFSLPDLDSAIEFQLMEIAREMLVNFNRHTPATKVEISAIDLKNGSCQILFAQNSPELLNQNMTDHELISAMKSKTMDRLVRGINADWKVELRGNQLVHIVTFDIYPFEKDPSIEIKKLRGASFDLIRGSFPLISILYGFIIWPALVYQNGLGLINTLLAVSLTCAAIAFSISAQNRFRLPLAVTASSLGLLVLPLAEWQINGCAELRAMPWIFNGLLATILLVSAIANNFFLKWIPLAIFLGESIISVITFPTPCHQILQGSTPGLVLIGVSALLIGLARDRAKNRDDYRVLTAKNLNIEFEQVEGQLEKVRTNLIGDLKELSSNLARHEALGADILKEVTLTIQKIRAFLLCSEYFELGSMRFLHEKINQRISRGKETKLTMSNSEVFEDFDDELVSFFDLIFQEAQNGPLEIALTGAALPLVQLRTDSQTRAHIEGKLSGEPSIITLTFI